MIDEFKNGFVEEVKELLLQLENDLITLENRPGNGENLNNIFRLMHTLKGSAGMVGFRNIQELTHEFEGLYECIREGTIILNSGIIDLTLGGRDLIMSMLNGEDNEAKSKALMGLIREKTGSVLNKDAGHPCPDSSKEKSPWHWYVVIFSPDKSIFERGIDPDSSISELASAGSCHLMLHEKKKTWELQKKEKKCFTTWEGYLCTALNINEIREIFLFYSQDEIRVFEIFPENLQEDPSLAFLIKRLYKNKKSLLPHLKENLDKVVIPEEPILQAVPLENNETTNASLPVAGMLKTETDTTVNVSSHKLDELMNLVSELVSITASIEANASKYNDPKLKISIENFEKLTKQFRNNALDLRLVPVGTLFSRFQRQVRDLSKELGKKVNLIIEGHDIEIDKTILRSIESPLQHIIRNSIDHGIESGPERLLKGKEPAGTLKIMAFYSGANVVIQVQDDGSGINFERVRECAIKKGLIQPDQVVTKQELINLIIEPGFTTSENISMVSGRGVGMDVVRKELNRVGGGLEIFTEKNLGTSITMKLPTTLTIIDTLLVEVADTQILIPVSDIEYCFNGNNDELFRKDNRYIEYKNNPVPLISLREQFNCSIAENQETMVIIINKFDRKCAVTADRIVGEHQAVIKPLGDLFVNQSFFSGGSIMVDGKLAFILDTNFLFTKSSIN